MKAFFYISLELPEDMLPDFQTAQVHAITGYVTPRQYAPVIAVQENLECHIPGSKLLTVDLIPTMPLMAGDQE